MSIPVRLRALVAATALAMAAPLLSACEMMGCTLEARTGVAVTVVDEAGAPIADAKVTLRDGDFVETLGQDDYYDGTYHGAYERAGTYVVDAVAPGFAPRRIEGVRVRDGGCHVETREVEIELTRE
jgi:hypothetical protein